jgi:tRNA A-37 threonylcarbamoyl transferase component Bud32
LHPGDLFVFHSGVRLNIHRASRAADVQRWSRGEVRGEVLKENAGRKVWRVPAGEPALFVKRFPAELFRDRARKEAAMLLALEKTGIPCPRLVAVARDNEGSYLLTEEIPGVRILSALLQKGDEPVRGLLESLGALARRLHDAGFEHQDFHTGNVLVREGKLFVIDVHRARIRRSLSRERRLEGVAFTGMSFSELVPRTDLIRFFQAYGLRTREEWLEVWKRLRRRREQYFRGRLERCLKEGTGFGVKGKVLFRKGIDVDDLMKRVKSGRRVVIKEKKGERLSRVEQDLFVKETRPPRARRIWKNSHGLALRGIDTPRLWAWGSSWVAGEWVESVDLYEYIRGGYGSLDRRAKDEFLFRLARMIQRLHDRGAFHSDLKAGNVLVGGGRILLVDLDRVRFSLDVPESRRMFNLAQLNAAVTPPLTRSDRLRFLHAYFGSCRSLWERRPVWVREIMKVTVARAHRWPPRRTETR